MHSLHAGPVDQLTVRRPAHASRVVHLTAEYWPWARTGGLAEAVNGLAESLHADGVRTSVLLPLYRAVRAAGADLLPVGEPFRVLLGARWEVGQVFRPRGDRPGPNVYFIDHAGYFDRPGIYGEPGSDYPDNARRFGFFSAAALQVLPSLVPDATVLHLHDWHTALAAMIARVRHPGQTYYDRLATVLTVHNAAFQGHFPVESLADLGLPGEVSRSGALAWYDRVNWLKGGLAFADLVTTVSPSHARELRTETGGFGLHGVFQALGNRLVGIVNGIDVNRWDPAIDRWIPATYAFGDLEGKRHSKTRLQAAYRFAQDRETPLVGMSARLVSQKGLPIIIECLLSLAQDAQFIFLGRGEPHYERALSEIAAASPGRIAVDFDFTDAAERRLLAGADLLLMPSLYEPCGLTQMRALRYGVIPVARRVGGLADTLEDERTGFLFDEYTAPALQHALRRACRRFADPPAWQEHIRAAMARDFSWTRSLIEYRDVYGRASLARPRSQMTEPATTRRRIPRLVRTERRMPIGSPPIERAECVPCVSQPAPPR